MFRNLEGSRTIPLSSGGSYFTFFSQFTCFLRAALILAALAIGIQSSFAGPLVRVPNTTLQMPASPPTIGYTFTNAFSTITFTNPLVITAPPGETNRLFIVEKKGRIVVITNLAAPTRSIFMDISSSSSVIYAGDTPVGGEEGLLGLAFHPGYATNGYFYVFYTGNAQTSGSGRHDILSRFKVSASDTNQGNAASEVRYIVQYDEANNHNAGDLHFGPDGYLYVSLGDEGGSYGQYGNTQKITNDFFSAIMRIDVDKRPGSLVPNPHPFALPSLTNYAIPPDNPWVGATSFNGASVDPNKVRTEFWAVGMRNPHRYSFDPVTGALFLGHVGQNQIEWVNIVTKGANCGWNFFEGDRQWTNMLPSGFTFTPPITEYGHTNGPGAGTRICVIGGIVYRGSKMAQLYGSYLYADYGSGEVWALKNSGTNVTQNGVIFIDAGSAITAFGVDPSNGDPLYCSAIGGINSQIKRIIYNSTTNGSALPATLADTGAFTNLATLTGATDPLYPASGIVPYNINVPFWSDNAIKSRWFSIPNISLTMGFNSNANWSFPTGTVWIKHFNLELTNGSPASAQRLETRLLVKNAAGVYGAVYRWDSQTNASLVNEQGLDEPFTIDTGSGILRTQVWHYPSRAECQTCHTPAGGFALGFRTEQLNCDFAYPAGTTNQLPALSDAGYFSAPVTADYHSFLALAPPTNNSATLEFRVRSFLSANCSQCHQPGGPSGLAPWDARITTPTALAGLINGPLFDNFGNAANHVITPLSLSNSVLLTRITTRDLGTLPSIQMPPLDSNLADTQAIALVTQWIGSLSNTFWLGPTPASQTAVAGGFFVNYLVAVLPTLDFTNSISLSVAGLPAGISAVFNPPSITGSNTSTLTVTVSNGVSSATFPFNIVGIGGGKTNSIAASLVVVTNVPGTLVWTAGGGDTNWSTSLNWTNLSGGYGPPASVHDVIFSAAGSSSLPGVVGSIVDANVTINSLWYKNGASPNTNQTTRINPGVTLTIAGSTNISGGTGFTANNFSLLVGTNSSVTPSLVSKIIGTNGALNINSGTGVVAVAQFNTTGKHIGVNLRAILDLSGLDTFSANAGRLLLGCMNNGSAGILYLARTNTLTLTGSTIPQLNVGDNNSNQGDPSVLYLGVTNAIFANSIAFGRAKGTNGSMFFNPAFVGQNPSAFFRGQDGASRVSTWIVSDLLAASGTADVTQPNATNDFSGGSVNALVDSLVLGKTTLTASGVAPAGYTSNRLSVGVLTFNAGTINANNITNGLQIANAGASTSLDTGIGVINANGGSLVVNRSLVLGSGFGDFVVHGTNDSLAPPVTSFAQGTLNIFGTSVLASNIVNGGGRAFITANNGTLVITNVAGTPAAPITTLALTNSTLRCRLDGLGMVSNIVAGNLVAAGVNTLAVDAVANVNITTAFPLLSYATFSGSLANFTVGAVAGNLSGSLVDNTDRKTIDFVVSHPTNTLPRITTLSLSGGSLVLRGTNGAPNWTYYLLGSTNLGLPLSNWTPLTTNLFDSLGNFVLTNSINPSVPQRFYTIAVP